MARFRTQLKHMLALLVLVYLASIVLLSRSTKKSPDQGSPSHSPQGKFASSSSSSSLTSSKVRFDPLVPDDSRARFIRSLPLKNRFDIERRHIQYNLQLDQLDEYDVERCGAWPTHYLRMRKQARSNHHPQRYLVHTCAHKASDSQVSRDEQSETGQGATKCGGLSERLMGAASLFLVSLLTDREFFVDWGPDHQLHPAIRTPFLNLAPLGQSDKDAAEVSKPDHGSELYLAVSMQDWSAEDLDTVLNIRSMNAYLDTHSRSSAREASLNSVHDQNLYRARQRYLFGLRDDIASTPQVEISLNRGLVHRILTDAAYSDRLETMGLHAYNAYECVLSFLFRPSLPIQELLHQYRAVFRKRGITTVGIYLGTTSERHSDQQSPKDAWDTRSTWPVGLSAIERTLTCAGNMTTAIRTRTRQYDQRFLYVVFTDSDVTKKRLQDLYGARMDLIFPPSRLAGSTYHGPMHRLEQTEDEALTLFESHLLSETDYQIITPSAFSKLALFRRGTSGRKTAVLMPNLENIEGTRGNERDPPLSIPDCSRLEGAFVTWEVLASFGNLG